MSWTDVQSLRVIWYLRDKYKVKQFIETGTYKGTNLAAHRGAFSLMASCEVNKEYYDIANDVISKCIGHNNAVIWNKSSPKFLKSWKEQELFEGTPIFYLDAHFYDKTLPKSKRFVVKDELKSLQGIGKCVIVIHDFCNGLGSINYDGIDLDLNLIRKELWLINSNFYFYTNTLKSCEIVKTKEDIRRLGLKWDAEMKSTLEFIWSKPEKTYRGLLYCLPTKLNKKEMKELGLREWI